MAVIDMHYVIQCFEMTFGGREMWMPEDENEARFVWNENAGEMYDRKKDALYDPIELAMELLQCDEDAALAWLKNPSESE